MSDETRAKDPGAIWRDQPEEKLAVTLEQIVNRRTAALYGSTRSEILMSIGAALLFVGVLAWRLGPARDRFLQAGLGAAIGRGRRPTVCAGLGRAPRPPGPPYPCTGSGNGSGGARRGRTRSPRLVSNTTARNWKSGAIT